MQNGNLLLLVLGVVAVFALGMDSQNKDKLVENYGGMVAYPISVQRMISTGEGNNLRDLPPRQTQAALLAAGDSTASTAYTTYNPSISSTFASQSNGSQTTLYSFTPSVSSNQQVKEGYRNGSCGEMRLDYNKGKFFQPKNFESNIAPRMQSIQLPSYIRYRMPDQSNLAVPKNPLGYPNQVTVNNSCAPCGKRSPLDYNRVVEGFDQSNSQCPKPDYRADESNYQQAKANVTSNVSLSDSLPQLTMTSVSADGEVTQTQNWDRLIFATAKSKNYSQSDFIRGDVPVVPCNRGYFTPLAAFNPASALNAGALAAMGGIGNTSAQQTYSLIQAYSGGPTDYGKSSFAGLPLDNPMRPGEGCSEMSNTTPMTISRDLALNSAGGVSTLTQYNEDASSGTPIYATAFF